MPTQVQGLHTTTSPDIQGTINRYARSDTGQSERGSPDSEDVIDRHLMTGSGSPSGGVITHDVPVSVRLTIGTYVHDRVDLLTTFDEIQTAELRHRKSFTQIMGIQNLVNDEQPHEINEQSSLVLQDSAGGNKLVPGKRRICRCPQQPQNSIGSESRLEEDLPQSGGRLNLCRGQHDPSVSRLSPNSRRGHNCGPRESRGPQLTCW